jgi:hypothetical protein
MRFLGFALFSLRVETFLRQLLALNRYPMYLEIAIFLRNGTTQADEGRKITEALLTATAP